MSISTGSSPLSSPGSSFDGSLSRHLSFDAAAKGSSRAISSGIPFEVLERIFHYTFRRSKHVTPSSDPFPLKGTTHLLLVSKTFHQLALRSFFHSITLAQPSDLLTFFQPKKGIFVDAQNPEAASLKWSYVREICIVADVKLPLSFPASKTPKTYFAPLQIPPLEGSFLEKKRVCFLDHRTEMDFLYGLQKEELTSKDQKKFEQEVRERLRGFLERLSLVASSLVMTSEFLEKLPASEFGRGTLGWEPGRLEVHDTLGLLGPERVEGFVGWVRHVTLKPVHLVGFSPQFVYRFEKEVERRRRRREEGFDLEFSWDV